MAKNSLNGSEKIGAQIEAGDLDLYAKIESQTSDEDKKSLLLLQNTLRCDGEYTFLEIGSHD